MQSDSFAFKSRIDNCRSLLSSDALGLGFDHLVERGTLEADVVAALLKDLQVLLFDCSRG